MWWIGDGEAGDPSAGAGCTRGQPHPDEAVFTRGEEEEEDLKAKGDGAFTQGGDVTS